MCIANIAWWLALSRQQEDAMNTLMTLAFVALAGAAPHTPIVNGTPDAVHEHWGVVLLQMEGGSAPGAMCTGTLITPDIVLTAAHCVDGNPSSIGVYFYGENLQYPAAVKYADEYVINHNWDSHRLTGDIALVHLSSRAPADFSPIQPLPPSLAIGPQDDRSLVLTFVGYGLSNPYDHATSGVRLTSRGLLLAHCDNPSGCGTGDRYQSTIQGGTIFYHQNDLNGDWSGPCSGDSGGPAFVTRDGVEYVAGVTSYGDQYCQYVGVSTKVDYYYDFISAYVQEKGETLGISGSAADGGNDESKADDTSTEPENCINGTDDDGDGLADCADPDCAASAVCAKDACMDAVQLSCGDELQGDTSRGPSLFDMSGCLDGWTEDGPEQAFVIRPPKGVRVTVTMNPAQASADMDLFLLDAANDSCVTDSCLTGSVQGAGRTETMSFVADGLPYYVLVETYSNPGPYTIRLDCSASTTHELDDSEPARGADFSGDRTSESELDNSPGGLACVAAPAGTKGSTPFSLMLLGVILAMVVALRKRG